MRAKTRTGKVLIVDDDTTLLKFLSQYLEEEGFEVITAARGSDALRLFYDKRPQLVILDLMLPGMDGWEVCARIRELARVPVILLTAKTDEADKLRGFRLGIDDYVTKPFSMAELTARVRAVLQRLPLDEQDPKILTAGSVSVDTAIRQAYLFDQELDLTPTEFRLLELLVRKQGHAVSGNEILTEIWGDFRREGNSVVRRYIWLLRQKIEANPAQPERLLSVRGFGYRLISFEESGE